MSLGDLPTDDKGSTWALREDAEEAHDNLAPSTQQHVSTELTRSNLNTQSPLFATNSAESLSVALIFDIKGT